MILGGFVLFQFLNGAIRIKKPTFSCRLFDLFQFLNGAIRIVLQLI